MAMKLPQPNLQTLRGRARGLTFGVGRGLGLWILLLGSSLSIPAATLQIQVTPQCNGEVVQANSLRYTTAAGERFSITRVSYLLSDFALQRNDGSWLEISNLVAWLDLGENRDTFRLENLPAGEYRTLHFSFGLGPN